MNIYFSGIGGVGVGPLAEIALDAGYTVQGSDVATTPITAALQQRGVPVTIGQDGEFLQACHDTAPIDWLVYTSALPADHPELVLARHLGIKTTKRDELLARIIREKSLKLIATAGTHGKTTTTGMLVWIFQQLGIPVSYSIGTTLSFGPSGKFHPASEYFIYECDEFDRNFLQFQPSLSLILSIDYDHPDIYPTKQDYTAAFDQFVHQSDMTIMWKKDTTAVSPPESSWILNEEEVMNVQLPGAHNRRNATLAVKALEYLQLAPKEKTIEILGRFPGTDRRFERIADNLYTDYGHHPVEIAAILQLAREISDHVVLVYQPHQNVRQHEVRSQYTDCVELAEEIYWLPTYLSREDPALPILTPQELTRNITNKASVHLADLGDELWNSIQKARDEGKLVIAMGAGSIDGWLRGQNNIKRTANVLVIDQKGNFILQKRDDKPGITNPGMITGFGGTVEGGETVRQAAQRELQEETNLRFNASQLNYLKTIFQPRIADGTSRWVTYYILKDTNISMLEVYEGQGYEILPPNADLTKYNLSPMIRRAIEAYKQQQDPS